MRDRAALTRVTFNVIPKVADDLEHLAVMTGLSRTDVLNRAVQVYRLVDEWTRKQGGLRLVLADGTTERVYIL